MYNGPWRDDDPNWTAEWKREVNLTQSNDGIFWMDYDTFISYFMRTSVAIFDNFASHRVENVKLSERNYLYKIDNPKT
jgi:hypothetical protein